MKSFIDRNPIENVKIEAFMMHENAMEISSTENCPESPVFL